jgi:hypothetical protein
VVGTDVRHTTEVSPGLGCIMLVDTIGVTWTDVDSNLALSGKGSSALGFVCGCA